MVSLIMRTKALLKKLQQDVSGEVQDHVKERGPTVRVPEVLEPLVVQR